MDTRNSVKCTFVKPVPGYGYFSGDTGSLSATDADKYEKLGFVKRVADTTVKPVDSSKVAKK
jgi:hypothetical protein